MTYQFSTTHVDPGTGRTHSAELALLANTDNWATLYSKTYQFSALPDDQGDIADPNVREWFSFAAQANADTGAASALTRDYTAVQVSTRTGAPASSDDMQAASDATVRLIWTNQFLEDRFPTLSELSNDFPEHSINKTKHLQEKLLMMVQAL